MNNSELKLNRINNSDEFTEGLLYIGSTVYCSTLELTDRKLEQGGIKIKGQTCIPRGKYNISVIMSPKFGYKVIYIHNVPDFNGVEIHAGNTVKDTRGCILVGVKNGIGTLSLSRVTLNDLISDIERLNICQITIE